MDLSFFFLFPYNTTLQLFDNNSIKLISPLLTVNAVDFVSSIRVQVF